ncbi:mechanosensitive ion channel family protein [Fulvimonas sp. R45]|uniref:mechanosensitive ion channel family protein n=1 Tax=Fulvimonas sp. R45 TaxID=3045937 RepID=UPI00265E1889|nr:mechanosensitive ion channel family protein [Fulvimonas sp. R45]MDO1528543.1 mechanosensitive ion channel family protein [Fulvimonas sp. R45]
MNHWLFHTQWLDNPTVAWMAAALGALLGYLLAHAAVAIIGARLEALAQRRPGGTAGIAAVVARATRGWLLLLLAIAIAGRYLNLPPSAHGHLGQLIYLLAGLQLAFWLTRLIVAWLGRAAPDGTPRNSVMFGILSWSAQLVVWVVVVLAVLANAGVNVNAFIASLGVGGVAVALAAQTVLGDLFASISIGLDKPFEVGESIAFGDDSGTVKRVGIKSTRIQSLGGEELSISNSTLLKERVHNYSRMRERRIAFGLRVAIDTPRARAERLVGEVRHLIEGMDTVRFDRGHMTGFGDCSLDFEFVYYVLDPGFATYRDIQQRINFGLMDLLDDMQVKLAVPVRALHGAGAGPAPAPSAS